MKVLNAETNRVVLELSSQELTDVVSAVSSVREEYEILDAAMLDVPVERIEALDDRLAEALTEANRTRDAHRTASPVPAAR